MTATSATTVASLAAALRNDVLSGLLDPGQPMREEQLSARFEVSRHTVRSALALLVAERLLTAEPYRGVRVSSLDTTQLIELQQLRTALECEAVHIAAQERAWDRSGVVSAIDRLAEVEAAGRDWVEVERAHALVHQAIVDSANSTRLSEAYRTLEGELALLLLHTRGTYSSRNLAQEHRALLDDLHRSGPAAIRAHIAESTRSLLERRGTPTTGTDQGDGVCPSLVAVNQPSQPSSNGITS